jgi:hypothetical protein
MEPHTIESPCGSSGTTAILLAAPLMRQILRSLFARRKYDHATDGPKNDVLDVEIRSVAMLIDDHVAFGALATEVAGQVGPDAIAVLISRLHTPASPVPTGFESRERGLGGWLAASQFAIFEILFQCGESALGVLREIAWGEYDWTQGNAIEILVRPAAKRIGRERTIADIHHEFARVSDEAKRYAVGPLLHRARFEPEVAVILNELNSVPDWREVVREVDGWEG